MALATEGTKDSLIKPSLPLIKIQGKITKEFVLYLENKS